MRLNRNAVLAVMICIALLCLCACEKKYRFEDGITKKTYDDEYSSVLSSWKLAVEEKFETELSTGDHKAYPNLPKKFDPIEWGIVAIDYTYYDVSRDGSPELIVAGRGENAKCHYIFDVYALSDGAPVRVFEGTFHSGFDRFSKVLSLSADGNKLIFTNGKSKKCYVIPKDGSSAQAFTDPCGEYTGDDLQELLYDKLEWHSLCEPAFAQMSASDFIDTTERKFKSVPEQYQGILNNYSRWIDLKTACAESLSEKAYYEFFSGKETTDFGLEKYPGKSDVMLKTEPRTNDDFGYGLHDLNGDKVKELLIMTCDVEGNKQVWDIFSIYNGEAKRLLSFKERLSCYGIEKNGTVHAGSSDDSLTTLYKYNIVDGGHIKEESVKATPITVYKDGEQNVMGYNYVYQNNFSYDPDEYNDAQEVKFSSKEGKEIYLSLLYEPDEDDAPFIKFIPLFD